MHVSPEKGKEHFDGFQRSTNQDFSSFPWRTCGCGLFGLRHRSLKPNRFYSCFNVDPSTSIVSISSQVSCRLSSMPRRDFSTWIFVHSGERWVTEFLEELNQHGRLNWRVVTGTSTWFCQGSPEMVSWGWKMMHGVVSPIRWDGEELVFYSKN